MVLLDGRTDSPTALGWQFGPCQTHSCENHKTVIRHAADIRSEAKARLRKINKPMKSGTRPTSSPNRTATRCRATVSGRDLVVLALYRSSVKSVVLPRRGITVSRSDHSLVLAYSEQRRLQGQWSAASRHSSLREGQERKPDTPDRGYGGPLGRQHSSASHPIDGFH
jgi:hypothetical protein